ncbi:MAG: hypothetical protein GX323_01605 [Clostridiales bacterium]|nr:hypothetical protein [Clostridiales bacterium]
MVSVFRKLIQYEFGKSSYQKFSLLSNKYFKNKYLNDSGNRKSEGKDEHYNIWLIPIYEDIFSRVVEKDKESIEKMRARLYKTVEEGIKIRENFIPAMLFFISTTILVFIQNPLNIITWIGILLMSVCFLYKTAEYLINKYCVIDKKIIMIYKLVLDTIYLLEELEEIK